MPNASSASMFVATIHTEEELRKLYIMLLKDLESIRNVCDNCNPTYKVRISQIRTIADKWGGAFVVNWGAMHTNAPSVNEEGK